MGQINEHSDSDSDRFYPSWTDDFHNKAHRRGLTLQEEQAKILVSDDLQIRANEITHKFTELQQDVFDTLLKAVKEDSPLQLTSGFPSSSRQDAKPCWRCWQTAPYESELVCPCLTISYSPTQTHRLMVLLDKSKSDKKLCGSVQAHTNVDPCRSTL